MKKYSSYKSIKPLNTGITCITKSPQSPTHSTSYRKLGTIDLYSQRTSQQLQVYPLSTKCMNSPNNNLNRKKMFSSKNLQTPNRPLTLNKVQQSPNVGYGNIRTKINDLESRLNQIKKNYDRSYNNRKISQKSNTKFKQNQRNINTNSMNKENEFPKQKKTQSKLLLERYQTNKKGKIVNSNSTINLNSVQNRTYEYSKSPLSLKSNIVTIIKTEQLPKFDAKNEEQQKKISKHTTEQIKKSSLSQQQNNYQQSNAHKAQHNNIQNQQQGNVQSPQQNMGQANNGKNNINENNSNSYLKQFVTTFQCQTKVPLSHSTSQKCLYKPSNKLVNPKSRSSYYVSAIVSAHQSLQVSSFENLCRQHMTSSLQILTYIKNNNKQAPFTYNCRPLPPVKDNRHTIIFDLDQTLIHCNESLNMPHDVALPIKFPNGAVLKAGINVRPYAKECLKELAQYFELIVFTASHQCYGNVIIDYLDPKKQFIAHRYFRDSCYKTEQGFYVKDLRVVDRDLKKVLLIDNAAYSYCFQLENGVPVVPFYDNKADLELKNLIPYLKDFLNMKDVRPKNSGEMKLNQYTNFKDIKTLINSLYASTAE